jgi:ElaB/YqjD/DUF883 family membrane-anchored ribosome-binding protein
MGTTVEGKSDKTSEASLQDDLDLLKEDMAALRKDLQSVFGSLKGLAATRTSEGVAKGKEMADDAGEHLEAAKEDLQARIRENPMTAVGLAFGAGVLIALLGRK